MIIDYLRILIYIDFIYQTADKCFLYLHIQIFQVDIKSVTQRIALHR